MTESVEHARSFLFVPASRPERFAKALATAADCVVIDLEDAVASEQKSQARQDLIDAFVAMSELEKQRLLVRINPLDSEHAAADLAALTLLHSAGLQAVMVPKATDPAGLSAFSEAFDHGLAIVALVESLAGLDNLDILAQIASVKRFAFGHLDFQLDLGMQCQLDEIELTSARFALVAASRRASLAAPIDGVTVDTRDEARLVGDVRRSKGFGFSGKLCIHPNQVEQVNAALAPSLEDISWAQRVVQQAKISGGEVFNLEGQMVDLPVILKAQKTLARAHQFGLTE